VVGVAVVGVALALIVTIQRSYGTLDDAELSWREPTGAEPPDADGASDATEVGT
jgi:hypothetical protein